jgi:hypothetical protein
MIGGPAWPGGHGGGHSGGAGHSGHGGYHHHHHGGIVWIFDGYGWSAYPYGGYPVVGGPGGINPNSAAGFGPVWVMPNHPDSTMDDIMNLIESF